MRYASESPATASGAGRPLVSVIIPCYRQAHFLAEAIQSALANRDIEREIIVVNDGSPDHTREVAAGFGDQIIYVEQTNSGLSGARNTGLRLAGGKYVAFLDSDDVCLPDRLATQARVLEAQPNAGLVAGDCWLYDGQRRLRLKSSLGIQPRCPANFRWETVEYCATPSTVMARRECFETLGLFDEHIRGGAGSGGEDWLMWVRLSLLYDMVYLTTPVVLYRIHPDSGMRDSTGVNAGNRLASAASVSWSRFSEYPTYFRARLLYYHCATIWHSEPKARAFRYFMLATRTDPTQFPFAWQVFRNGLANSFGRWRTR